MSLQRERPSMMAATETASSFNYVVTANRPTSVRSSVVGNFTSDTEMNLILSKGTRLEIWKMTEAGLKGVSDVPIYGRIAVLHIFRPPGESKDVIFLSTEHYQFCVLEWDPLKEELRTRARGTLEDKVGRPAEEGQRGVIDSQSQLIGMHIYHGLLKVIPILSTGALGEAFNIRLDEFEVLDLGFLHVPESEKPVLAVLYQDLRKARHIKTYFVSLTDKELQTGPWAQRDLDAAARVIAPIPLPMGGAVVLGENVITYLTADQRRPIVTPVKSTLFEGIGRVDDNGARWLLSDHVGQLMLLALVTDGDGSTVTALRLETLGTTTPAQTLSYLDNGCVYLGSKCGDSQLVRLSAEPVASQVDGPPEFVEILEDFTNIGPIVDFAVVPLDRQGQGQVVTCSGIGQCGTLRIVRNGIGTTEQASIGLPGINGIWSLKAGAEDQFDKCLVLAFVRETRVLSITADDELDEVDFPGFDGDTVTLHCADVTAAQIIQVTHAGVRLVSAATRQLVCHWQPQGESSISLAASSPTQVLVALKRAQVVVLAVAESSLKQIATITLDSEVSCLDLTPLGSNPNVAQLAVVATWAMTVHVLSLPTLEQVTKQDLGGEVIPRSVLLADFEDAGTYVLCALGDGQLCSFRVDVTSGALSDKRRVLLGTKPVALRSFRSGGARHVFAACDRPTVIYAAGKKLMFSNVNDDDISVMTPFNSAAFPDSLAVVKEDSLSIGTIDEVQKLHIQTVPLGEQPRRIAHQASSSTYAVAVEAADPNMPGALLCAVRLFDKNTFETKHRFELDPNEQAMSISSGTLNEVCYYLVGTAFLLPEEQEPSHGRILVMQVRDGELQLVHAKDTKGSVYEVRVFQGKVLAAINSRVQIYKWSPRDGGASAQELLPECGFGSYTVALMAETIGDSILVGDIIRSVSLLTYKSDEGTLEARARDHDNSWVTAISALDEETFLAADNSYNMYVTAKNSDAAADEERTHLQTVGRFHVGEFINRIRHGSLVMKGTDAEQPAVRTQLFATISGAIGVVAQLQKSDFLLLEKLQVAMRGVINGVGGFSHEDMRTFQTEFQTSPCIGFVDGDLIEQFSDLEPVAAAAVVERMGGGITLEEVSKKVEDVSRLH